MDQPSRGGFSLDEPLPFSGKFLAEYELLDVLGEGGMGLVLLARQRHLDREVAIKVLKSLGPDEVGRFEREGRLLSGLVHPRILKVLDAGVDNGLPFLVFERITGRTLEGELRLGPFTLGDALLVGARVADALEHAHSREVVHRDVKPDNVFLLPGREIKLADFGLARDAGSIAITTEGTMLGTPDYMAPEQARGDPATPLSDQYALGVTVYRLACSALPFAGGKPLEIALARLRSDPSPIREHCPGFPAAVEEVVMRALAKQPQDRWPTMGEFREALESARDALGPDGDRAFRPRTRTARSPALAPPEEGAPGGAKGKTRRTRPVVASAAPTSPWKWIAVGALGAALVAGLASALLSDHGAATASASPSARPDVGLAEARQGLLDALDTLRPLEQLAELRTIEAAVRLKAGKMSPAERRAFLRARWREHFDAALARSRLVEAAQRFRPADALHQRAASMDPPTWLALQNHVEDLAFLCFGLGKHELPQPLEPSAASRESAHVALEPPAPYERGTGFRLPRHALGGELALDSHPRGGPIEPLDAVDPRATGQYDDRFFTTAIVMGIGNETAAIYESFEKLEQRKDRIAQISYTHPEPLDIPEPASLEAAAISVFVSDLDPEHRFEVYLANDPVGPFRRRVATFRGKFRSTRQLWCPVEPAVLPGSRVYVQVRFTVLPGLPNSHDDADLHQVALHFRRRR